MVRKYVLRIILTVMFFALAVLSGIIPGEAGKTVAMFLLPLAAAILTGILAGSIYGLLVGVLSALVIFFIRRDSDFLRDTLPMFLSLGTSGFFAGLIYGRTGTAIGASVGGVLAGRIALSLSKILILYFLGEPYTVFEFLEEAVTGVWPGLIICLVGIPVIIFMLRSIGVMAILGEEKSD